MKTPHGDKIGEVAERYRIDGIDFEIVAVTAHEYAVRHICQTEIMWIRKPNHRFETLGGARGAILIFLEGVEK